MNPDQDPMQLIKERFAELPQEVKDAVTATDLMTKMRAIGDKYNLLLDKQGDLQRSILLVMLGLIPSSEFISSISGQLNVNGVQANLIAKDVSEQIFGPIRTHLREWEEQAELEEAAAEKAIDQKTDQSDLERLGDFTIEPTGAANTNGDSGNGNGDNGNGGYVEKRPEILDSIENPQPAVSRMVSNSPEKRTDPLVDHLMTTPTTIPPQKIIADPYREPIK